MPDKQIRPPVTQVQREEIRATRHEKGVCSRTCLQMRRNPFRLQACLVGIASLNPPYACFFWSLGCDMAKSSQKPDKYSELPESVRPADWLIKGPHRPPNTTIGDETTDPIFQSVGTLLTVWEHLETMLAIQFGDLCSHDESQNWTAVRAYGSVLASGTRCDMLLAAAEQDMAPEGLSSFRTYISDVRKLASLRNIVAHGMTISVDEGCLSCAGTKI